MSGFEEYIKVNYPRDYERQKRIYPDQRVEELYSEDYKMWQHQQAIIDDLRSELNNMEACYIEKKKQVEDQQKRIDAGLEKIHQFGKEGCLFPEWLTWAEKALRGEHE